MSLKHLELGEMVGLTSLWVRDLRALLEGIPQLACWLPALDQAHGRVVAAQPPTTPEVEAEIAAVNATEIRLDVRHDELIRCVASLLEAEQHRCRAAEPSLTDRDALCERATQAIFPDGLVVVNALYLAEAGTAQRTRKLVSDEGWLRDLLSSIKGTDGATLLSVVESWCEVGERLGTLEQQKMSAQNRLASAPLTPRPDISAARHEWIKVVNHLLSSFDMIEGHERVIEDLRTPVLRLADIAGRRRGARGDGESAEPASPASPASPAAPAAPPAPAAPAAPAAPVAPGMPGAKPYV